MNLEDTLVKQLTYVLPDYYGEAAPGTTQAASVAIKLRYRIFQNLPQYGGRNGILIALFPEAKGTEGSFVQASPTGKMMMDTYWSKYWFTESVDVTMQDYVGSGHKAGTTLIYDGPANTPTSQTLTSAISVAGGFSGNGPNLSGGYNSTDATTIVDFKLQNTTSNDIVKHRYQMAATPSGGVYNDPDDIFSGFPVGAPYDPPAISVDNLPLVSQAFWICQPGFHGTSYFCVEVDHTLMALHCNANGGKYKFQRCIHQLSVPLFDWSSIKAPT
jgi:hypothetical protein